MQLNKVFIIAVASVCLSATSSAQTTTGSEIKKADVDFTELANYRAAHPTPFKRRLPFDESRESEPEPGPEPDPSQVHLINRNNPARVTHGGAYLPVSVAPVDTFLAVLSNGEDIPPDSHGDINPDYCVTAVNSAINIQNRVGSNIIQIDISSFWGAVLPSGTDPFDPKILYDPNYKRWVFVTDAINQTTMGSSTLLVAVTETCNPRGIWHQYAIPIDPSGATWLDFPNIGFNKQWVTITGNMFSNATGDDTGSKVFVFNYASLMAGSGATYTEINETPFTLCPAITYDFTESSMFLIDVDNGGSGELQLWKITGPVGSPVMTSVGYPTSTEHWKSGPPRGADFAPQLGTTNKVDADDNRIHRLTCRNGNLWCAHTIFLPATGTVTRCSVMWWEIDTLASPIQNGVIDDPATPSFFMFPSITVNANNDALVGFADLSGLIYPSAAYAIHMHTDPADSIRPYIVFRHGQTNYFQNFGGANNRWGDYSAACVDPINNLDFWTIQECVPSSPANYWDTWWAHVMIASGTSGLTAGNDTTYTYSYDSVKFNGIIAAGTVATWSFSGGTALPGTGTGNQDVKWTTPGTEIVTLTDSVPGCTLTFADTIHVLAVSGVKPLTAATSQEIQIVPNPNDGVFDILFTQPVTNATVTLTDMMGRTVYTDQFTVANNKVSIVSGNLPPGTYLANVNADGSLITQKITVNSK